jgi:arabinofuranosyltransferase
MSPESTQSMISSAHSAQRSGSKVLDVCVFAGLAAVFLKNYWVSEDAYLNFRSVAQLLAGNGPIWNPHERVQVFTSPLWYGLEALTQALVREPYLAVLLLSSVCFGLTLHGLRRCSGPGLAFAIAGLTLVASSAAFDYSSSGQENVLGYALLLYALQHYLRLGAANPSRDDLPVLLRVCAACGLLFVCRHDLAVLVAPWLAYAVWSRRQVVHGRARWQLTAALGTPLALWTAFSLLYYGSAFPNPAYAKLSAGFPRLVHVQHGLHYVSVLARYDLLSVLCVAASVAVLCWQRTAASGALAAAMVMHTGYVVYVGGDYMQGRFVSYEVVLAAALLARAATPHLEGSVRIVAPLTLLMYALAYPRTPLNTSIEQPKPTAAARAEDRAYVLDARGTFGLYTSLYSYLRAPDLREYPAHPLAIEGRKFGRSALPVTVVTAAGMFGWAAGTSKIVVEAHGIADPLLARLPASAFRGVGHYARYRPEGYVEGLSRGRVQLEDAGLAAYYGKVLVLTQQRPLLGWARLRTIALFNLGAYDGLLEQFVREKIVGKQRHGP